MYVVKYSDLPHEYKRNKENRNHDTENIKKQKCFSSGWDVSQQYHIWVGGLIVIMFSWCLHSGLALARLQDFTSIGITLEEMSTHYNQRRKIPEKKSNSENARGMYFSLLIYFIAIFAREKKGVLFRG